MTPIPFRVCRNNLDREVLCEYNGIEGRATLLSSGSAYQFKGNDNTTFAQIPVKQFKRLTNAIGS